VFCAVLKASLLFTGYTGYLTNVTINGQIAQQHNCATVVIEHRASNHI
jgi:hypothetical protein